MGDSGAGKSTVLNLIAKYYQPQAGRVTIGGQDIRDVPAEQVLERISLVDQDVFLFNDTVRNNIRYARPSAADQEVEDACRLANCDGFIRTMEQGYETELINGVPSFCAAAARLGIPLVNGAEELHVIPASYPVREALGLAGVKVFMKAGTRISELKKLLEEQGCRAVMVENCGMKTERVYGDLKEIPEDAGYFSLLVAR